MVHATSLCERTRFTCLSVTIDRSQDADDMLKGATDASTKSHTNRDALEEQHVSLCPPLSWQVRWTTKS